MGIVNVDPNKEYVTYFNKGDIFNKDSITINLESNFNNKPKTGFWGSPVDAAFGWKEWCENEEYGDYDFENPIKWKLKEGKIFQVDWDDLETDEFNRYLIYTKDIFTPNLDFITMHNDEIIAVELLNASIGHSFLRLDRTELMFNSWDCESIVVLDKDCIVFE